MKVILPSNGILGTKWLDMREPTYGDLRGTINATPDEYLFKYEFVKGLCDFDPKTISADDLEYLYDIAASAVTFNILAFKIACPKCGTEVKGRFDINNDDIPVATLKKDCKKCKKTIDGVEYVFNILSAQDALDIHTYAFEEGDEDKYNKMIEEATVCKVLGYDITEENIKRVTSQIPIAIYVGCFLFINANKHGMVLVKDLKCPQCGEEVRTRFDVDSSWIRLELSDFVEQFAMVRDCLDFQSYLKFTVPEFKHFVEFLNNEARKLKSDE